MKMVICQYAAHFPEDGEEHRSVLGMTQMGFNRTENSSEQLAQ